MIQKVEMWEMQCGAGRRDGLINKEWDTMRVEEMERTESGKRGK